MLLAQTVAHGGVGRVPALVELPIGDSSARPSWRFELDLGQGVVLRLR